MHGSQIYKKINLIFWENLCVVIKGMALAYTVNFDLCLRSKLDQNFLLLH